MLRTQALSLCPFQNTILCSLSIPFFEKGLDQPQKEVDSYLVLKYYLPAFKNPLIVDCSFSSNIRCAVAQLLRTKFGNSLFFLIQSFKNLIVISSCGYPEPKKPCFLCSFAISLSRSTLARIEAAPTTGYFLSAKFSATIFIFLFLTLAITFFEKLDVSTSGESIITLSGLNMFIICCIRSISKAFRLLSLRNLSICSAETFRTTKSW